MPRSATRALTSLHGYAQVVEPDRLMLEVIERRTMPRSVPWTTIVVDRRVGGMHPPTNLQPVTSSGMLLLPSRPAVVLTSHHGHTATGLIGMGVNDPQHILRVKTDPRLTRGVSVLMLINNTQGADVAVQVVYYIITRVCV